MLGFSEFSILAVYVLCIASALLCIVYGVINWNKGDDEVSETDAKWVVKKRHSREAGYIGAIWILI